MALFIAGRKATKITTITANITNSSTPLNVPENAILTIKTIPIAIARINSTAAKVIADVTPCGTEDVDAYYPSSLFPAAIADPSIHHAYRLWYVVFP